MSLKEICEQIYVQIEDKSSRVINRMLRGIDDVVVNGTKTLGGGGNQVSFKIDATNVVLDVVSSSGVDTVLGTGARKVKVQGLFVDSSDGNKIKTRTCVYNMDGVTPATVSSGTNSFCVVNSMEIVESQVGSLRWNAGDISAYMTGTTVHFGIIQATKWSSKVLLRATATDSEFLLKELHISAQTQTGCSLSLFQQDLITGGKELITKLYLGNSHGDLTHPLNHKVPQHTGIYVEIANVETVVGTNHISANISCIER